MTISTAIYNTVVILIILPTSTTCTDYTIYYDISWRATGQYLDGMTSKPTRGKG